MAEDRGTGERVAVKIEPPSNRKQVLKMEATVLQRLQGKEGRRGEGLEGQRGEGLEGRRDEGLEGRRDEGLEGRRDEWTKEGRRGPDPEQPMEFASVPSESRPVTRAPNPTPASPAP